MNDKKARKHKFKDSWQKNYDSLELTLAKLMKAKIIVKTHALDMWNERVNRTRVAYTPQDIHRYICSHVRKAYSQKPFEDIDSYFKLWGPRNCIMTLDNDVVLVCKLRCYDGHFVVYVITTLGRISDNSSIGTEVGVKTYLKHGLDVRFMDESEIECRLSVDCLGGI